jgi:hypothetical protein
METWLPRDKQWFLANIALGVREEKKKKKKKKRVDFTSIISRARFEDMNMDYFHKCIDLV